MQSTNRRYVPVLDVLRAAAALWVVLYHTVIRFHPVDGVANMWLDSRNPVLVVLSQGWLGVSIFVMLSGYSLSLGVRQGDIRWSGYLTARWLRVAPLYLVVLALATVATPAAQRPSAGSFLAALTMLPVPDAFTPGPWLATAWSVRIEVVLYLFIPAFLYAAKRYRPVATMTMGAVLALLMFAALLRTAPVIDVLYWGLPGRLVEFGAGFFLGYAGRSLTVRPRRAAGAVAMAGFVAVAYAGNRSGGFFGIPGATRIALYVAVLLLGALLLAAVDQRADGRTSRVVAAAAVVGTWSYSIYLWHAVVINLLVAPLVFDRETFLGARGSFVAGTALVLALVLVVSWASFNLIERPFLALRPRYVRAAAAPQTLAPNAVAMPVPQPRGRVEEAVGAGGRS